MHIVSSTLDEDPGEEEDTEDNEDTTDVREIWQITDVTEEDLTSTDTVCWTFVLFMKVVNRETLIQILL